MVRGQLRLNESEFEQTVGDSEGQKSLDTSSHVIHIFFFVLSIVKFVSQWQSSYSNSVQMICRADICLVHQAQLCVMFTVVTPANP